MIKLFKRNTSYSFASKFILYFNFIIVFAILLSYLSCYVSPQKIWILGLFGLSYPFLLLLNIGLILFWILLGKRHFIYSVLAIIIGYSHIGEIFQFNGSTILQNESYDLLSFNVHNFSKNHSGIFNKEAQKKCFNYLKEQNADIVCIQEFCYSGINVYASHAQLKSLLEAENYFFESYFKPKKNKVLGMVTYSRFPIINKGIFEMSETRKFGIFTDLLIGSDTIRLYNIHLESIRLNYADYSYVTGINVNKISYQTDTKQIIKKIRKASQLRSKQVSILRNHMVNSPYPTIVCGDFNDTPLSYAYHYLSDDYKDAFVECGEGFGKTLKGFIPSFRIDYVLLDECFKILEYNELGVDLSDHYPVLCRFSLLINE